MCSHRNPNRASDVEEPKRLGKNAGGYHGETIDIDAVLADCVAAAERQGWTVEQIPAGTASSLIALTRAKRPQPAQPLGRTGRVPSQAAPEPACGPARPLVYLSTGIHGDEPAGPLAMRQLLQSNEWPKSLDLSVCPCLNPEGFRLNRRENAENLDLNRQYRDPQAIETQAHIAWLQRQPGFDLCLCLHEDWESHGFYVYELNPEHRPSLAELMVESVSKLCPIDRSEVIEGRPARNGIIRPDIDPCARPQWPEAFYLLMHKTRLSYTLEAPSDFPLPARAAALAMAVNTALRAASALPPSQA
jgi:hypothetical protein